MTPLREAWDDGRPAFGTLCIVPSAHSAEIAAQRGFDWVALDWQHGFMNPETSAAMISAVSLAGAAPLVRLGWNDPRAIAHALDMGAYGVIVPLVNDRDEAERAVSACRYPPIGTRSYGPVKNAPAIGTDPAECNRRVLCFAMIETSDGLDNVEEICATPGLDGIYIGPGDLRISLGLAAGEMDGPIETILAACKRHGIVAGLQTAGGEQARAQAARGFGLIGIGTDADFLAASASRELAAALGRPGRAAGPDAERAVRAVVWGDL